MVCSTMCTKFSFGLLTPLLGASRLRCCRLGGVLWGHPPAPPSSYALKRHGSHCCSSPPTNYHIHGRRGTTPTLESEVPGGAAGRVRFLVGRSCHIGSHHTTSKSFIPPPQSRGGSSPLVRIELAIRKFFSTLPPTSSTSVKSEDET